MNSSKQFFRRRRMRMMKLAMVMAVVVAGSAAVFAETPAGDMLKVEKVLEVGGNGRWDYVLADGGKLYLPRSTRVAIVDPASGSQVAEVPGTAGVHGVAIAREQGLGFASAGRANAVVVFDLKTFNTIKSIPVGKNPDAIIYDPASKHILAMEHTGGAVAVIDPAALDTAPVEIPVGGALEFAVADGAGKVFVNVEDKSEIVEIDSKANKVLAHWPLGPGEGPTGLAYDAAHHRLFAGCDGNSKMAVVDADSGKLLAAVDIGKGVDGCAFDAALSVAVSANGDDGTISVIKSGDSTTDFPVVQTLKTVKTARTVTVDASGNLYLPCTTENKKFGVVVVAPAK